MTAFTDALAAFPHTPRVAEATGFLPPLFRAHGHLLFALGLTVNENLPEDEGDVLEELRQAMFHIDSIKDDAPVSTTFAERLALYQALIGNAITELPEWEGTTRINNLRALIGRAAQLTVLLDRELLGLRDSDTGTNL